MRALLNVAETIWRSSGVLTRKIESVNTILRGKIDAQKAQALASSCEPIKKMKFNDITKNYKNWIF